MFRLLIQWTKVSGKIPFKQTKKDYMDRGGKHLK